MALTTKIPGEIIIAENPDEINGAFGTCMLGSTYGSVESASVKRGADMEEIQACGGKLLAAVMKNAHFELTLKTIFSTDIDPPGLGDLVVFPIAGVKGRVIPTVDIEWEKAGMRMLSINVKSWDVFTTNEGAASAKSYDGVNPGVDLDT